MATIEERLKDAPARLIILAACGFARTGDHVLPDQRSRDAIDVAERFADGLATEEEVRAANAAATAAAWAAEEAAWAAEEAEQAAWVTTQAATAAAWAVEAAWGAIQAAEQAVSPAV